jgi:hypothetical protein
MRGSNGQQNMNFGYFKGVIRRMQTGMLAREVVLLHGRSIS